MVLKEIQPFDKAAFRQTRTDSGQRIHAQQIERAYPSQVVFIAKLLGQTNLNMDEINAVLKSEGKGNLLARRLIKRLDLENQEFPKSPLSLNVDCELLDRKILGYTFQAIVENGVCPLVSINYCNDCDPELEVNGELVQLTEPEWPRLMYGLVGLVEDIQAVSTNTN
jgi:hypothetical protein